jgi:hypothetical protein
MPIAASLSPLQTQIQNAFKMNMSAQSDTVALSIVNAVVSIVPTGLFPMPPPAPPIPLSPAGASAAISMVQNAYKMGMGAQSDTVATMLAQAISVIAPLAPPSGLSLLQTQLKNAYKLGMSSQSDTVAMLMAQAIIQYYLAGGII